jgi:hypothetical protein
MRSSGKPDSPLTSPWFVVYRDPYKRIIKRNSPKATFFITFCALSEAKGMDINMLVPKTAKRKIASIKVFFNYMEYKEKLTGNPFNKLDIRFSKSKTFAQDNILSFTAKILICFI